jgi:pro-sigmaK processing inhibitor BofA
MVISIKYLYLLIKKIILTFLLLFSLNLSIRSFGIIIPINMFNILVISILGIPGILGLIVLKIFLF